jgi:hypothetical protein
MIGINIYSKYLFEIFVFNDLLLLVELDSSLFNLFIIYLQIIGNSYDNPLIHTSSAHDYPHDSEHHMCNSLLWDCLQRKEPEWLSEHEYVRLWNIRLHRFPSSLLLNNWIGRRKTFMIYMGLGTSFIVDLLLLDLSVGLASHPTAVTVLSLCG